VIDVGVLVAMAAMSLPFVTSSQGDRSSIDADALPALILLLPIFVITLIPDHTRPIHPIAGWASLALGLAALPYAVVKLLDAGILADTLDGSLGGGAYLLLIGTIITIVGIGIGLYRNLRGLPAGGTPGRSAAFFTRAKSLRAPKQPQRPRKPLPPEDAAEPVAESAPSDGRKPAAPQPEMVIAEEGAAPREVDGATERDVDTTAERADAAIDDHIMSMFEEEDSDGD
jgi:hypothetical protein